MVADDRVGVLEFAGIDVHLAAAGLAFRESDRVAEPFQDAYRGLRDLRIHRVDDACGEQCDFHGESHPLKLWDSQSRTRVYLERSIGLTTEVWGSARGR